MSPAETTIPGVAAIQPFIDAAQELLATQVRWIEQLTELQAIWLAPWFAMQSDWLRVFVQPPAAGAFDWPDPTAAVLWWQRGAEQLA